MDFLEDIGETILSFSLFHMRYIKVMEEMMFKFDCGDIEAFNEMGWKHYLIDMDMEKDYFI
jgi:hypothetical protein